MRTKKTKIIRYLGIVLIVGGIVILAYPFYTNFIMRRQESQVLDAWASQVSALSGETSQSGQINTSGSSTSGSQDAAGNTGSSSSGTSQSQDTPTAGPAITLSRDSLSLTRLKKCLLKY